jgi:hypothetical protein
MRNCPARIATEQVATRRIKRSVYWRKMSLQSWLYTRDAEYLRCSARKLLKLARKARIPLYLSFAQRKSIYRLPSRKQS